MKLSIIFSLMAAVTVTAAEAQPNGELFGSNALDMPAVSQPRAETKNGASDKGLFDDEPTRPAVVTRPGAADNQSPLDASETACDRIIGGECAEKGKWPSQVAMYVRQNDGSFSFSCGGSIIAKRWILTAAHCVVDGEGKGKTPDGVFFVEGTIKLNGKDGHNLRAKRIIAHENYSKAPLYLNDIALVELLDEAMSTPISFNTEQHEDLERAGQQVIAIGWGLRKYIVRDPGDPDQIIDAFTK